MFRGSDKARWVSERADPLAFHRRLPFPTVVGVGGGIESQASAAIPNRHASTATGDIEFVAIETNFDSPGTISTAGWAEAPGSPVSDGSTTCLAVWWHRYTSGDGLPTINDSGDHQVAYILAIRGLRGTATPFDAHASSTEAASTTATFPTISTISWNSMILFWMGVGRDLAVTSGMFTEPIYGPNVIASRVFDRTSAIGGGGGFAVAAGLKAEPGSTETVTAALGSSQAKAFLVHALR